MKITLCAYDAPNNIDGPTTWIKRLLPCLRQQGIETRLLFLAATSNDLTTLTYFKNLGFVCKHISTELFFEEQLQAILEDIAQYPPDVFVPNYFPVAGYASRYIKKAGIPSIMVLHNDDAYHHALVDEFGRGREQETISCFVPVSKLLAYKLAQQQNLSSAIQCIPYGAPVPEGKARWGSGSALKLIYLGRFNQHQKRISKVTKALCKAVTELPNTEAIMYGNGPALQEVQHIIATEGKGKAISYGGVLPVHEIQATLLQHHVFVLLSKYEGIPIALMEAMACGLVPVCSNIESGISELITDQYNGFIVKDNDQAFINSIRQITAEPALWKQLSEKARSKIEEDYSDKSCHQKWVMLVKELAKQNTYSKTLPIPSIKELKSIRVQKQFLSAEVRYPSIILVPLYRLKKGLGRLKRKYFN